MDKIGNCEICGLVDHHLEKGVCPACRRHIDDYLPEIETLREAASLLVPIAIAAAETGMLTERMAKRVREIVARIPVEPQDHEDQIAYEAALPGGNR